MDVFLAQAASSSNGRPPEAPQTQAGGAPIRLLPSAQSLRAGSVAPQSPVGEAAGPHTPVAPQSKLDKVVATGSVIITELNRRATGENLTYTASDDKFVLTGGPPSIFDAEHGKITAVSLTLFRRDGRVVVEGDKSSPAVTETKVVR